MIQGSESVTQAFCSTGGNQEMASGEGYLLSLKLLFEDLVLPSSLQCPRHLHVLMFGCLLFFLTQVFLGCHRLPHTQMQWSVVFICQCSLNKYHSHVFTIIYILTDLQVKDQDCSAGVSLSSKASPLCLSVTVFLCHCVDFLFVSVS